MNRRPRRDPRVDRIRRTAVAILLRWREGNAHADTLLVQEERRLGSAGQRLEEVERRRLRELALGTVRFSGRYRYLVGRLQRGGRPPQPAAEACLWLALHEFLEMDGAPHAVVDQYVRLVRETEPQASGFVNGMLRNFLRQGGEAFREPLLRDPLAFAEHWASHPRWLVERWARMLGPEEMVELCAAGNRRPRLALRCAPGHRAEVASVLADAGATVDPDPIPGAPDALLVADLPAPAIFRAVGDRVVAQDPAAQRVAPLLRPASGEWILDPCAAPGGKATHLAQQLGGEGTVVAGDSALWRLPRVRDAAQRLGLDNLGVVVADGTAGPWCPGRFDAVLVDAPCTGTGVLSRRHDARWRRRPEDLQTLPELQRRLLHEALDVVRPGGRVLYSTCSLEPEENDEVVDAVLAARDDTRELGVSDPALDGMIHAGRYLAWPHRHGFDGAFAAVLQKVDR